MTVQGPIHPASIIASCEKMGLVVPHTAAERLAAHANMVLQWNERLNLTRIVEPAAVVLLHVVDSLTALESLELAPTGAFADLGAGAGFPGIPLAIMTGRPACLVESVKKKAAFLKEAIDVLGVEASVVDVRAEELAVDGREAFSAVTARALSSLPSLVELAAPLVCRDGLLVALKGVPERAEVESGDRAAAMCGMAIERLTSVSLPDEAGRRTIVVYRRTGRPTVKLPRRPGMAQRHPLA